MGRDGPRVHVLDGDLADAAALIGLVAGEHLVHHDAEGVQIAARVGALAAGLLRRDIVDRADRLPLVLDDLVFQRGDAEVGHLDGAVLEQHDVVGLDVAVDDAALVRVLERAGDLPGEMQRLPPAERAAALHIHLERDPVDILHHEVFDVVRAADVVDRDDVVVGELGDRVRLREEAAAELLVLRHLRPHDLHGDLTVEAVIRSLVDHGHAALADHALYLIAAVKDTADIGLVIHRHPYLTARTVTLSRAPRESASSISARQRSSGSRCCLAASSISSSEIVFESPSEQSSSTSPMLSSKLK